MRHWDKCMIHPTDRGNGNGRLGGDDNIVRLVPNGARLHSSDEAVGKTDQARQVAGTLRHHLTV